MRISILPLLATVAISSAAHGQMKVVAPVTFEQGSTKLAPGNEPSLKTVREFLIGKPDITLMRIEGHAATQELSEKRALMIARLLTAGEGVDCKRLLPVGFGATKPLVANDAPDAATQNQRIEFVNVALRGHVIGGMPADGGGRPAGDPCQPN